jgi:hypothetical protein
MSDTRLDPSGSRTSEQARGDDPMGSDLEALRHVTARDLTTVGQTLRAIAARRPRSWRDELMGTMKQRPWLATACAVVLIAFAALVIPFSYQRTTGHEVTLTLTGKNLDGERVGRIAQQLKGVLHSEHVMVSDQRRNGESSFVLTSMVPLSAGVNAIAAARVFGNELEKIGYTPMISVTPIRERVSGTVYAYARDRVIEVDLDGKSAAAIETEIRQRLVDAGIDNFQISVTNPDGNQHELKVKLEGEHVSDGTSQAHEDIPQLVLKKGGAPVTGANGFMVRIEKRHSADGTVLEVNVQQGAKSATAEVPHSEHMSDDAIAAAVESQLESAGLDVVVHVSNGAVEIKPRTK